MLDGAVLSKTVLLGTSGEQTCTALLVLAAVDGAVALPGWCWRVRLCGGR